MVGFEPNVLLKLVLFCLLFLGSSIVIYRAFVCCGFECRLHHRRVAVALLVIHVECPGGIVAWLAICFVLLCVVVSVTQPREDDSVTICLCSTCYPISILHLQLVP